MAGKLVAKVKIKGAIAQLVNRLDDAAIELAAAQKANIVGRLRKGTGTEGAMPGYGQGYAHYRAQRGRQIKYRDLQFTGAMIRDLHAVKTGSARASLRFRTSSQKIKAWANQRRARWFGMTDADKALLKELLLKMGARKKG